MIMEINEYYEEITEDEYLRCHDMAIKINKIDINIISKYLNNLNIEFSIVQSKNKNDDGRYKFTFIHVYSNAIKPHFYILSIPDEWYLVYIASDGKFYKCDQIDGLTMYLKDVFVNKII